MRKIYEPGQAVGVNGLVYIQELDSVTKPSGIGKNRFALFKCSCANVFRARLSDVLANKRTSCGCKKGVHKTEYKTGDIINGVEFLESLGVDRVGAGYIHYAVFKCPVCGNTWRASLNNIKSGKVKSCCLKGARGWSRTQWTNYCAEATLYKVLLYNDNESFIKIGMTSKKLSSRMKRLPYKYKVLKTIKGTSGYIYDLENRVKRLFKQHRYSPLIRFKGETECFNP